MAEKNGNVPWCTVFHCLEEWLRLLASDFEGARKLAEVIIRTDAERPVRQPKTVAMLYAGYSEMELGKYGEATRYFDDPGPTAAPKILSELVLEA